LHAAGKEAAAGRLAARGLSGETSKGEEGSKSKGNGMGRQRVKDVYTAPNKAGAKRRENRECEEQQGKREETKAKHRLGQRKKE
jgi:hypothetical protein